MLEPVAFESFLERRYARSTGRQEPLIFELTEDPALKHQYYLLREDMCINMLGTRQLSANEDVCDARSHVIVARRGRQCLAGVRLTVKEPGAEEKLPLQAEGFPLADKHLRHLSSMRSAEVSCPMSLPDDADGILASGLAAELYNVLIFKKVRLAFFSVGQPLAGALRQVAEKKEFSWHLLRDEATGQSLYMADLAMAYKMKDVVKQCLKSDMLSA